jgi:hypothetical protein
LTSRGEQSHGDYRGPVILYGKGSQRTFVTPLLLLFFSKDIRREDIDLRTFILPSIGGEAGLLAGVFQKRPTVPSIFCGDLRQKKT